MFSGIEKDLVSTLASSKDPARRPAVLVANGHAVMGQCARPTAMTGSPGPAHGPDSHSFLLRFEIPQHLAAPMIEERLVRAGCVDALPGFERPGIVSLWFRRPGKDLLAARSSALKDVYRALPYAVLFEVSSMTPQW